MEITLEQGLAAAVRYIQDHAVEGTKLYFDEIPESFFVPSVYFQIPYTSGRKVTLRSYAVKTTLNCWFMERYDWDAEAKAADMRDMLLLDNCCIPVYEENGTKVGYAVRVAEPETRKIDEGIVQLSFSFEVYFHPGQSHEKMQRMYTAWNNIKRAVAQTGG